MPFLSRLDRSRAFGPLLLLLAGLCFLGPHAAQTGLHIDDHGFHHDLARADWPAVWTQFTRYVPGRNLHILYYAALYKALGPDPARLHVFGLLLDLANVGLVYALLRQMRAPAGWPLLISGLFLVYPNHAETHFWTVLIVQCLVPTALVLSAFLLAGAARLPAVPRLAAAFLLYGLAVFDYDQVFFMWVPLLFYVWKVAPRADVSWRLKAGFATACLAMNIAHVLLRIWAPVSSGGRPMIRLGHILFGFKDALLHSLLPMRKLPLWDSLQSWLGGPPPTIALAAALSALWTWAMARAWPKRENNALPPALAAGFGALWFLCAYMPNFFWYVSARHNYLPSFGWLLMLAAAAAALSSSLPSTQPALAGAAFLSFGLFGATTMAEGTGWELSSRLQDQFRDQVPALLDAKPENLFLLGAPRSVARAPGFEHPQEALYLFEEAAGHLPAEGDLAMAPGRAGAFFGNEVELFGRESLRWRPYSGMNVLTYSPKDGFVCAGGLVLKAPGEKPFPVGLGHGEGCSASVALEAPVWLLESRRAAPRGAPLFTAGNGVSLLRARARPSSSGSWIDLELEWRAEKRPSADFASIVSLLDSEGNTILDSVHAVGAGGRSGPPLLWPAFNDIDPASSWRAKTGVRETYRLSSAAPPPAGRLKARFALFERVDGNPWRKIGEYEAPLER